MILDKRTEPGHCWVSGKPVNEIISYHPDSHPLAGHVKQVGKPLPEMTRVTFLLVDGKRMDLSIHKDHISEINLNDIWHSLISAENTEYSNRKHLPHYDKEKCDEAHLNQLKLLCPPIGILCHG